MPTSVGTDGVEDVTPGPDKNASTGATVAAASGGKEPRVNLEVGGEEESQEVSAGPDDPNHSAIMPTSVGDDGVGNCPTAAAEKNASAGATGAAVSGGTVPCVNPEVGGVDSQQGSEAPRAGPPSPLARPGVGNFPTAPAEKNASAGATMSAAASSGEAIECRGGVLEEGDFVPPAPRHVCDAALITTTNVATFPTPPVANDQAWPTGWSTAPKPPPPESLVVGHILTQPGAGDEKPSTPQRSNTTSRALHESFTPFVCSPSSRRRTLQYPLGNGTHVLCCFSTR